MQVSVREGQIYQRPFARQGDRSPPRLVKMHNGDPLLDIARANDSFCDSSRRRSVKTWPSFLSILLLTLKTTAGSPFAVELSSTPQPCGTLVIGTLRLMLGY